MSNRIKVFTPNASNQVKIVQGEQTTVKVTSTGPQGPPGPSSIFAGGHISDDTVVSGSFTFLNQDSNSFPLIEFWQNHQSIVVSRSTISAPLSHSHTHTLTHTHRKKIEQERQTHSRAENGSQNSCYRVHGVS